LMAGFGQMLQFEQVSQMSALCSRQTLNYNGSPNCNRGDRLCCSGLPGARICFSFLKFEV